MADTLAKNRIGLSQLELWIANGEYDEISKYFTSYDMREWGTMLDVLPSIFDITSDLLKKIVIYEDYSINELSNWKAHLSSSLESSYEIESTLNNMWVIGKNGFIRHVFESNLFNETLLDKANNLFGEKEALKSTVVENIIRR